MHDELECMYVCVAVFPYCLLLAHLSFPLADMYKKRICFGLGSHSRALETRNMGERCGCASIGTCNFRLGKKREGRLGALPAICLGLLMGLSTRRTKKGFPGP